jgi:hypothetical protein
VGKAIRRREFIIAVIASAVGLPITARAQHSERNLLIIGVLWHAGTQEDEGEYFDSLVQGFRDFGYIEGPSSIALRRKNTNAFEALLPN